MGSYLIVFHERPLCSSIPEDEHLGWLTRHRRSKELMLHRRLIGGSGLPKQSLLQTPFC